MPLVGFLLFFVCGTNPNGAQACFRNRDHTQPTGWLISSARRGSNRTAHAVPSRWTRNPSVFLFNGSHKKSGSGVDRGVPGAYEHPQDLAELPAVISPGAIICLPDSKLRIHAQPVFKATSMSSVEPRGRAGTKFVQKQPDSLVSYCSK